MIINYFSKTLNDIYLERLREEIEDCEISNAECDNGAQKKKGDEEIEKEQIGELSQKDSIALKRRNA